MITAQKAYNLFIADAARMHDEYMEKISKEIETNARYGHRQCEWIYKHSPIPVESLIHRLELHGFEIEYHNLNGKIIIKW